MKIKQKKIFFFSKSEGPRRAKTPSKKDKAGELPNQTLIQGF